MSTQKKPTFSQVKSKAEELKALAYELAYDQLPQVLKSKKGAVQKNIHLFPVFGNACA